MNPADAILREFDIPGEPAGLAAHGSGHINDSFIATFRHAGRPARYLVQRLNARVFPSPRRVMENIQRVTEHIGARLAVEAQPDAERRVLTLVPARDGAGWIEDDRGDIWRVYRFIEAARSHQAVREARQAREAAARFGHFQRLLADLPGPPLHTIIPDFHNTPLRFDHFIQALESDAENRARLARPEIEFAQRHQAICETLAAPLRQGLIPTRIAHNDTKLNNVLFDTRTDRAICVVDLDTVMPGLALDDWGDMVRTMTSPAEEDERDPARVGVQLDWFEAVLRGYLSEAGDCLCEEEKNRLAEAARVIPFEQGLRFLTDYLAGDRYYRTQTPDHNLVRCRTQFQLVRSLIEQEDAIRKIVEAVKRDPN